MEAAFPTEKKKKKKEGKGFLELTQFKLGVKIKGNMFWLLTGL